MSGSLTGSPGRSGHAERAAPTGPALSPVRKPDGHEGAHPSHRAAQTAHHADRRAGGGGRGPNEVRAAIHSWKVPIDPSVAVLLTSELVTNALRHEAGKAIELVVSCAYSQLQVDVYDTSPAVALQVDVPAGEATGQGLMLLAGLSSSWGYYRTPGGKVGYFTLMY